MKKLVKIMCGIVICWSFSAKAQIDLGIDDFSSDTPPTPNESTDSKKGLSFFDRAINLFSFSQSKPENKIVNIDELKANADKGDVGALLDLGYMYLYGADNVKIDYAQALTYYTKAAEQKNPVALNNLGSLYFSGIGVNVDYTKAIAYFEEAAKLGSDDAAVNLAIIYLGSDAKHKNPEDLKKALNHLQQAEKNNNIAKYLLGYCYMKGFLVKQNLIQAFPLIKAAADAEYDEAMLVLADFYINGWGTPKNYNRAVQYLKSAAAQGNAVAIVRLGDIYAEGKIYTQDIKKAHIQYNIASVMGIAKAAEKRDELEKKIKIDDLLSIQSRAEEYVAEPSAQTSFIQQTYGNSLKLYIDLNIKAAKKAGDVK